MDDVKAEWRDLARRVESALALADALELHSVAIDLDAALLKLDQITGEQRHHVQMYRAAKVARV